MTKSLAIHGSHPASFAPRKKTAIFVHEHESAGPLVIPRETRLIAQPPLGSLRYAYASARCVKDLVDTAASMGGLAALLALLAILPCVELLNNTLANTPTVCTPILDSIGRLFGVLMDPLRLCVTCLVQYSVLRQQRAQPALCSLQMGFNTWNAFGRDIDEQLILQTGGFLNNLTLSKLGYNLIVLDGKHYRYTAILLLC